MIPRYTLAEMGAIWSEETRFERMLEVELAVAEAQARRGLIPGDALDAIRSHAHVDLVRIAELEQTTDHEVVAFVNQLAESVGPEGRFLHLGLDQFGRAGHRACAPTAGGRRTDRGGPGSADRGRRAPGASARRDSDDGPNPRHPRRADHPRRQACGWAFELDRGRSRLRLAFAETAAGKLSGPVGTYSHLEPELEAEVLSGLGLEVEPAATQVVARDRHAALVAAMAVCGGTLERIATEIRNLQHTEIAELAEPFKAGQTGSSAMPHKRNPITAERISGQARLLRGYALATLEDQALWHERDISHSSVERVALPDATTLLDYMLVKMTGIVDQLRVDAARMRLNLERGLGLWASSRVLLALVDAGLERATAYTIVQRAALSAAEQNRPFADLIAAEPEVAGHLSSAALIACFDEGAYLHHATTVIDRLSSLEEPAHVRS